MEPINKYSSSEIQKPFEVPFPLKMDSMCVGIIFALPIAVLNRKFDRKVVNLIQHHQGNTTHDNVNTKAGLVQMLFYAPVFEELLYRYCMQKNFFPVLFDHNPDFLKRLNSVIFSTGLFVLSHVDQTKTFKHNASICIRLVPLSLTLGTATELTGDIWTSTFAHIAFNLVGVASIRNMGLVSKLAKKIL